MTPQEYIRQEFNAGRFTLAHIEALVTYYQNSSKSWGFGRLLASDGKPGPKTREALEKAFSYTIFAPPKPKDPDKFLRLPLPLLPGRSTPQARKPVITSGFGPRGAEQKQHDGVDFFYRWEVGDQPAFVGDGGAAGKNADGSPKWVVPYGTYAHAAADGVVTLAGPTNTGYRCWIDHGNGLRSGYFHLETLLVWSGAQVRYGRSLGLVGHNPADRNDGRHLHFEVSPVDRYEPVDPERYLSEL